MLTRRAFLAPVSQLPGRSWTCGQPDTLRYDVSLQADNKLNLIPFETFSSPFQYEAFSSRKQ